MRVLFVLCVALIVGTCSLATGTAASESEAALAHSFAPAITAADFAAHIKTLASDRFAGREPGSEGERLTTDYLVTQFKRMGLQPGNDGEWLQKVPTVSTTVTNTDATLKVRAGGKTLKFSYGDQFIAGTLRQQEGVGLEDSDIVFAGYGVDAAEFQWNDYAGVDVKGKTVIVLVNDPGWGSHDDSLFKGREMTYYGRWTYKYAEAARKGAAACFVVHETAGAGYGWDVVDNSWSGPQFALPLESHSPPVLPVAGWLTTGSARRLFAAAGKDFDALKARADQRGFKPVLLGARANLALESRIDHIESHNVLAMLKGNEAAGETIVYTAHWDHLGTDTRLKGDHIYNGAIDNATGVAALLEIAGAFETQQPQPKRSVLFTVVTLEESGLLGSEYYVAHPVVPLATTVVDINMDALPIIGPARDMIVVGYGNSSLDNILGAVTAAQGRHLTPDPTPEQGSYFRSDHLNFAMAGVPSMYAKGGNDLVDGGLEAGRTAALDYNRKRYHKPADNYDPDWDLRGVIQDVRALYAVGRELAGSAQWPQWAADSPFRAEREKTADQRR